MWERDLDLRAMLAIYGGAHGAWAPMMTLLSLAGGGWFVVVLVPLIWHERTRLFGASLAGAVVTQAVLVWTLKLAIGRVRPWIALGLPPPLGAPHDASFPSGHASGSFCVASFLAVALPHVWRESPRLSRVIAFGAIAVAALVALSRVYLGAHFPSDVVAGAALGAVVGAMTAELFWVRARSRSPVR